MSRGQYSKSENYRLFRSWVAQQKIIVIESPGDRGRESDSFAGFEEKAWKFYDYGPKTEVPIICVPGVSGTAEVFFKQFISLCPKGYRLISIQYPAYNSHVHWVNGFDKFLDKMHLSKVHIFGSSLGGFLAQCYAAKHPERTQSLILCNTFCDTQYFHDNAPCAGMFQWMPEFMLKRYVLASLPVETMEAELANAVDFVVEQVESMTHAELVTRLTLNTSLHNIDPKTTIPNDRVTILDTMDHTYLPSRLREEVYKIYPDAKLAQAKTGGNFPFLSRADEVNLHLEVHLRKHGLKMEDAAVAEMEQLQGKISTEEAGSQKEEQGQAPLPSSSETKDSQEPSASDVTDSQEPKEESESLDPGHEANESEKQSAATPNGN